MRLFSTTAPKLDLGFLRSVVAMADAIGLTEDATVEFDLTKACNSFDPEVEVTVYGDVYGNTKENAS